MADRYSVARDGLGYYVEDSQTEEHASDYMSRDAARDEAKRCNEVFAAAHDVPPPADEAQAIVSGDAWETATEPPAEVTEPAEVEAPAEPPAETREEPGAVVVHTFKGVPLDSPSLTLMASMGPGEGDAVAAALLEDDDPIGSAFIAESTPLDNFLDLAENAPSEAARAHWQAKADELLAEALGVA